VRYALTLSAKTLSAMVKATSSHSKPKSALAVAIVAIPVAPPLETPIWMGALKMRDRKMEDWKMEDQ